MWISFLEVALVGAVLCLDRIILQMMVSRPIVAGPVIGAVLKDPATGLVAGAFMELFWMDQLPIGKYVPPNDTVATIIIAGGTILAGRGLGGVSPELIALAVLLFAPFAFVAKRLDILVIKSNEKLSLKVTEDARRGDTRAIAAKLWWGVAKSFSGTMVLIFVLLVIGSFLLEWLFPLLPMRVLRALTLTYCFIPVLGVAVALNTIKLRGALPVFAGLFLIFMLAIHVI